jgi:hypothetical protein
MQAQDLLNAFLAEECTPHVRSLLREALEAWRSHRPPLLRHFEFNRFELTLDLEHGTALLADVLQAGPPGEQHLALQDLVDALALSR